jgi:hypothetical protein
MKPGQHGSDCGCCAGTQKETPATIGNSAGLPIVSYRVGTYAQFRRSLLAELSSSKHPALQGLRTRRDDDFTIALCDALAVMADTLTFYQERIANESFLRTAIERRSIVELAALIGYQPAPGVAASTYLAFGLEEAPGAKDQAPVRVTIPLGARVQSVPPSGGSPQTFETIEELVARSEWNAIAPQLTAPWQPQPGRTDLWVEGARHNLERGDVLLIVGKERRTDPSSRRWQFRALATVTPDNQANRTRLTWMEPLDSDTPAVRPRVYVFGERAAIFGHNAPDWAGQPDTFKATYLGFENPKQLNREDRLEWPLFTIFAPDPSKPTTFGRFVQPPAEDVAKAMDEAVKATILAQGRDVVGAVVQAAGSGGEAAQQVVQAVMQSVGRFFGVLDKARAAGGELWDASIQPALDALNGLGDATTGIGATVSSAANNIGTTVSNAASDVVEEIGALGEAIFGGEDE